MSVAMPRPHSSNANIGMKQEEAETQNKLDNQPASPSRTPTGQAPVSQGVRELMLRTWKTRKSQERDRRMQEDPLAQAASLPEASDPVVEGKPAAEG